MYPFPLLKILTFFQPLAIPSTLTEPTAGLVVEISSPKFTKYTLLSASVAEISAIAVPIPAPAPAKTPVGLSTNPLFESVVPPPTATLTSLV
ncbi:hypothetical protein D3C85_1416840 [compost metagenome]